MAYNNRFKNILGEPIKKEVQIKPKRTIVREDKESELNEIEETSFNNNEEKLNEKDETQILLLNEVLKRLISVESKLETSNINNIPIPHRQENNKKIVVNRDEQGKIIGAEIVEG